MNCIRGVLAVAILALVPTAAAAGVAWQWKNHKTPDGQTAVIAYAVSPPDKVVSIRCWTQKRAIELVYVSGEKAGDIRFAEANEEGLFTLGLTVDGTEVFDGAAEVSEQQGILIYAKVVTPDDISKAASAGKQIVFTTSFYGQGSKSGKFDVSGAKTALQSITSACPAH